MAMVGFAALTTTLVADVGFWVRGGDGVGVRVGIGAGAEVGVIRCFGGRTGLTEENRQCERVDGQHHRVGGHVVCAQHDAQGHEDGDADEASKGIGERRGFECAAGAQDRGDEDDDQRCRHEEQANDESPGTVLIGRVSDRRRECHYDCEFFATEAALRVGGRRIVLAEGCDGVIVGFSWSLRRALAASHRSVAPFFRAVRSRLPALPHDIKPQRSLRG